MSEGRIDARIQAFSDVMGMAEDAMALLAVYEVGVFAALVDGPRTALALGEVCGVAGGRLAAFLDRTAACGLLRKSNDRYALVDGDQELFDPGGRYTESLGFSDVAVTFGRMARSVEVLRTDVRLEVAGSGGDTSAEERERFLRYLHGHSVVSAAEVAERLCGESITSVVDLGSGLGTYTAAILSRCPAASGVLVDRSNAASAVEAWLGQEGLADRTRFVGGDFLTDDFGRGFDLALLGNLIHFLGEVDSRRLLDRLHGLLVPGGRVAIKDIVVDDDRLAPAGAGRFALMMAIFTDAGGVFPASEAAAWLEDAGFVVESNSVLTRTPRSYLVVGRRA
jgi:SAM-dependent methyltransferase